jgi:hypothetical protein
MIAVLAEHPEHGLGVGDVHLAAVGFDVDALHNCKVTGFQGFRVTKLRGGDAL